MQAKLVFLTGNSFCFVHASSISCKLASVTLLQLCITSDVRIMKVNLPPIIAHRQLWLNNCIFGCYRYRIGLLVGGRVMSHTSWHHTCNAQHRSITYMSMSMSNVNILISTHVSKLIYNLDSDIDMSLTIRQFSSCWELRAESRWSFIISYYTLPITITVSAEVALYH